MKKTSTNPVINVLGTEYHIYCETSDYNSKMDGNSGLCEPYSKRIIIDRSHDDKMTVENFDSYCHRVLRHEVFHAVLFEAGLSKYYEDEDLVEALAVLYPKIKVLMEQADKMQINKIPENI